MSDQPQDRFRRLLGYLDADPDNPALLADAIRAALDVGEHERAEGLAAHLRLVTPGGFEGEYLSGLAAMYRGDFASAAARFDRLLEADDQPSVRFNLAWSRATASFE